MSPLDLKVTPEQVRELFTSLRLGVEGVVGSHASGIMPMLGVLALDPIEDTTENFLYALDTDFNSVLGKKKTMKAIAALTYKKRQLPLAVGLVSEAWMAKHMDKESYDDYYKKYLLIADDPQRIECVQVSALGFHGPQEPGIAVMDCRAFKRERGQEAGAITGWDGEWMRYYQIDGGSFECNILERFFHAYAGFALRQENPDNYLSQLQTMEVR